MPIDPRIALGYQPTAQLESPVNVMAKMQALKSAQQQNAMQQMQMDALQADAQRKNALRAALMGADISTPEGLAKARQAYTNAGDMKGFHDLVAAQATSSKATRESDASQIKLLSDKIDLSLKILGGAVDQPSYDLARERLRAAGLDDSKMPAQFSEEYKNSEMQQGLTAKERLEQHFQTQDYGGGERIVAMPKYGTGAARVVEGSDVRTTLKPGEAERDAETRRHNLETERAATDRLAFDREKMGAGGEIDAKEKSKREAAYPKVSGAYRAATHEIDSLITDIESLRKHPGLSGITGLISGRTPNVTGPARQAQAILDRVLAKGQFRGLQAMREASPTGGALGNISDKEGAALRAAFGALSQTQDTKDFKTALDNVLSDLKFSKGNIDQTYADTYAYKGGNTPAAAPTGPRKTASGVSYTVED